MSNSFISKVETEAGVIVTYIEGEVEKVLPLFEKAFKALYNKAIVAIISHPKTSVVFSFAAGLFLDEVVHFIL